MTFLFFFIGFLSLIALIASLILLPFKRFRLRAKRLVMLSGVIFVVSFIVFVVQSNREDNESARQQGFADASDQRKAAEAGITDSAAWTERQRLAEEAKARERQAEEEKKRVAEEAKESERKAREEQKQRAAALRQALLKPPAEQDRFVQAIEKAREAYKAGQTDLQRGAARPARAREICSVLPSSELRQWIGKIASLTTNGSGEGVLVVEISKGLKLMTMNNSLSDSIYGTMIKPGSSLYQKLLEMKQGDFVRFDASLFRSDSDCYTEISLTMQGSIEKPEFVTNFARVTRVDVPSN